MIKDLVLGVDYETRESIVEKTAGITSIQSVNYRRRTLIARGIPVSSFIKDGVVCYLRDDADKIINYEPSKWEYPKNRKEVPGRRPGKQKVKKNADP